MLFSRFSIFSILTISILNTNVILGDFNRKFNLKHAESLADLHNFGINTKNLDPQTAQDAFLTAPQLVNKYGYPSETHHVVTLDGYILEMHRIANPGKQPVLLMHGLLDSSSTWVVMGPKISLGYMLHDLGYDVWMGNVRGNRYSRKHKRLSPEEREFWQFSWHEMGIFDVPAMINYVLDKTSFEKLHYIGHSQGSTVLLVMSSLLPQYNKKILSMQALAPVGYVEHCRSPLVRVMTFFLNTITFIANLVGINEFMPNSEFLTMASQILCNDESFTQPICSNIIFLMSGFNTEQLNTSMLPVIIGHSPAGASAKQMIHFGQLKRSGYFRQYDYGFFGNIGTYGRISPPDYDVSKVSFKVAFHYSLNDFVSEPVDVLKLYQQLPNTIGTYLVPYDRFNHLDFVWAIDVRKYLYNKIVEVMQKVESGQL